MKLIAKAIVEKLIAFNISGRLFNHRMAGVLLHDDEFRLLADDTGGLIITDATKSGPIHTVRKEIETPLIAQDRIN